MIVYCHPQSSPDAGASCFKSFAMAILYFQVLKLVPIDIAKLETTVKLSNKKTTISYASGFCAS